MLSAARSHHTVTPSGNRAGFKMAEGPRGPQAMHVCMATTVVSPRRQPCRLHSGARCPRPCTHDAARTSETDESWCSLSKSKEQVVWCAEGTSLREAHGDLVGVSAPGLCLFWSALLRSRSLARGAQGAFDFATDLPLVIGADLGRD